MEISLLSKEVFSLVSKLKDYDVPSYEHSKRVAFLSRATAIELGLSPKEIESIFLGGFLHDLGKLKISTEVLNSPNKLTDEEFTEMKNHPLYGLEELKSSSEILKDEIIIDIIINHHERIDGSGYPNNKKGDELTIYSRISAATDSYDAMTDKREYNIPKSKEDSIADLRSLKYDQRVVDALEKVVMRD